MQPPHELQPLNKWRLIHTYDVLVDRGQARPVECPDCACRLVPRIKGEVDDGPAMWCYTCNTYMRPGLDFWAQVIAVVKEHHDVEVHLS